MNMYRKFSSIFLVIALLVSMVIPVAAVNAEAYSTETKERISEVYNIPLDYVMTLSDDDLSRFAEDIDTTSVDSTQTTYWEFYENNGEIIANEKSEQEYLQYDAIRKAGRASSTHSSSWMRITVNLYSVNTTKSAASATYEWLYTPSYRLYDYVALSVQNGVMYDSSPWGYYEYSYRINGEDVAYRNTFSNIDTDTGYCSIAARQKLVMQDYPVVADTFYLYMNFTKSSSGDTACASYAHQIATITGSVSYSIPGGCAISISPASKYDTTSAICRVTSW